MIGCGRVVRDVEESIGMWYSEERCKIVCYSVIECYRMQRGKEECSRFENATYRGALDHRGYKGTAEEDIRLYYDGYNFTTHLQRRI